MNCDCEVPTLYSAKIVKVRKPHKCVECGFVITPLQHAEKVDGLWSGAFLTFYTCVACVKLRDFLNRNCDDLSCHGELKDFLYSSNLLYSAADIEREAQVWIKSYDKSIGVVRGANCVVASHAPSIIRINGRFCLAAEYQ